MNQRAKSVFIFFMLGGIVNGIDGILKTKSFDLPYDYGRLAIAIIIGGALGWISYYLVAYFLSIAGDLMKGKATVKDFRTVIAWSLVPSILSLLVIIPQYILYGAGSNSFDIDVYFITKNLVLATFIAVKAILGIWTIVILVKGVAYIQQFSIGKAILNILIPILVIVGIILSFIAVISIASAN